MTQAKPQTQFRIYRVTFSEPPYTDDTQTDFFFTSLAAIYDIFTREQIGCKLSHLWGEGISSGRPYKNKRVTITTHTIYRKTRQTPCTALNSEE